MIVFMKRYYRAVGQWYLVLLAEINSLLRILSKFNGVIRLFSS
jgi:hypothetical protein